MIECKEANHGLDFLINMGNFESLRLRASATVIGTAGETEEDLFEHARHLVQAQLEPDIHRALSCSANDDSFASVWLEILEEERNPQPPRLSRRRVN